MDQSTIVFTHYALLLTAGTFLLIGGSLGWAFTNYLRSKDAASLRAQLRELQMRIAGQKHTKPDHTAATKAEAQAKAKAEADAKAEAKAAAGKLEQLSKKKDALIKDFMKRQMKQQESLDKVTHALKIENQKTRLAEKRLNAASISLDQWKEKCSTLTASQTLLQKELAKLIASKGTTAPTMKTHSQPAMPSTPAAVSSRLSVVKVAAQKAEDRAKTATTPRPLEAKVIEVVSPTASDLEAKGSSTGHDAPKAISKSQATTSNNKSRKPAATKNKKTAGVSLTRINGIGPAIEKALGELGINSIEQIATLKQKDAKRIDKELGKYSGRMVRQNWVSQAKKLHSSHQKEAA